MQKQLVLLVGPQGSGKTTLYKEQFSTSVHISQDLQGKEGHKVAFAKALKDGKNIVVDRINHTREQRERYLKPAKEQGYETHIIVMQVPYNTCYDRIRDRKDHPTLQVENAHDALSMYFFQYQAPKKGEADSLIFEGKDEQFVLDISEKVKDKRVIVIGDLHGVADELNSLLLSCGYQKGKDVLLFVGDLVDRGAKIDECLMGYVGSKDHLAYSVMGNHEYKFVRYLLGRKVNPKSLKETIEQTNKFSKESMIKQIMSFPFCIKFRKNSYVVHAGINPLKAVYNQYKDELMYTRNVTMSGQTAPWWKFYYGEDEIFFGHEVTPEATQVADKAFAMDGGACFGMDLRACIVDPDGTKHFYTKKCETAYATYSKDWNEEKTEDSVQVGIDQAAQGRLVSLGSFIECVNDEIKAREALVTEGFLSRKVYKDLFLYNYTPKCTYEKYWNETTRASRGIIFDSVTGELVSWTPDKFFNVNEMPETILENLPTQDYQVFEKVDGSFVSVSWWEKGQEWIFATRGSFESEQAHHAQLIFLYKDGDINPGACEILNKNYTYIFEVLYPENRHNEGARLVVDYGDVRTLVGLAIYDKVNKKELTYIEANNELAKVGFRHAKKFNDFDLNKVTELQKTLGAQDEGFVVLFANGLRVKFKTEEYVRMNRILNSMNVKTVWESMVDGKVPVEYMRAVPEEIREEAEKFKAQLESEHLTVLSEFEKEAKIWVPVIPKNDKDSEAFKTIGLFMKDNASKFKYPMLVFPWVRNKTSDISRIIKDIIRPKLGI